MSSLAVLVLLAHACPQKAVPTPDPTVVRVLALHEAATTDQLAILKTPEKELAAKAHELGMEFERDAGDILIWDANLYGMQTVAQGIKGAEALGAMLKQGKRSFRLSDLPPAAVEGVKAMFLTSGGGEWIGPAIDNPELPISVSAAYQVQFAAKGQTTSVTFEMPGDTEATQLKRPEVTESQMKDYGKDVLSKRLPKMPPSGRLWVEASWYPRITASRRLGAIQKLVRKMDERLAAQDEAYDRALSAALANVGPVPLPSRGSAAKAMDEMQQKAIINRLMALKGLTKNEAEAFVNEARVTKVAPYPVVEMRWRVAGQSAGRAAQVSMRIDRTP